MNILVNKWFVFCIFLFAFVVQFGCGDGADVEEDTSGDDASDSQNDSSEEVDSDDGEGLDTDSVGGTHDTEDTDSTFESDSDSEEGEQDTEPEYSGTPYFKLEIVKESGWNLDTVKNTLSRRILGLRWQVKGKGLLSKKFEIWPESGNKISDARMYQLSEMFKQDPWVVSAQPVYVNPNFVPPTDDTGKRPIDDPVWYLGPRGINAYEAWEMIEAAGKKPGEGVLVGLPDTGYLDHPELFRADGSTQLRLDLQRNFAEKKTPNDAHDFCDSICGVTVNKTIKFAYVGHGSTCASLIISPPGKQPGTVGHLYTEGAAQYAGVIPIRVAASVLMTPFSVANLAKGVRYATEQGVHVISISMGGLSLGDGDLKEAIKEAVESGVIVVAAAGNTPYNSGSQVMSNVSIPAAYPETIAVCGSNAYEVPWRDTSRGPEADICAPAEDIRRARAGWVNMTEHVNDTDRSEGTSMATALTASVAAMWVGYHGYDALLEYYDNTPSKIPEAFRQILHTSGHRRPADWETDLYGAGIIDAARVLEAELPKL